MRKETASPVSSEYRTKLKSLQDSLRHYQEQQTSLSVGIFMYFHQPNCLGVNKMLHELEQKKETMITLELQGKELIFKIMRVIFSEISCNKEGRNEPSRPHSRSH